MKTREKPRAGEVSDHVTFQTSVISMLNSEPHFFLSGPLAIPSLNILIFVPPVRQHQPCAPMPKMALKRRINSPFESHLSKIKLQQTLFSPRRRRDAEKKLMEQWF
jgi:hypothetical protein